MRQAGIWRFLPPARAAAFAAFLNRFQAVRQREGWGAAGAEYYRGLPYVPKSDPQREIWRMRTVHFHKLLDSIALELARQPGRAALSILDLGAGNCWLANQLVLRGHRVCAVDISDDPHDGLAARAHYTARIECYQAEYDRLPFAPAQFDLVVFNAAIHYTAALVETLREGARVIVAGGQIVVLDSPFYTDREDGQAMLSAREARFLHDFGLQPQAFGVGFLTPAGLEQAAAQAGLQISVLAADDGWRRRARRALAQLRTRRAQARFPLLSLRKG
jgi:SAM-dependent methyltransferase